MKILFHPFLHSPGYYCMPDRKGSMATHPWNNPNYLVEQMTKYEYSTFPHTPQLPTLTPTPISTLTPTTTTTPNTTQTATPTTTPTTTQTPYPQPILSKGYRITANEWDAFYEEFLDLPGAVFASSFREPVDRWYSQYR